MPSRLVKVFGKTGECETFLAAQALKEFRSMASRTSSKSWRVIVETWHPPRSLKQNNLLFMWYNCIVQEQQGIVTKDAVMMLHEDMKRRFLPVREGKSFGETVYVTASTRDLDTVEFTRFLDKVNGLAAEHGISLPWPDDLAFVAFSEHYYPLIDDQMKKSA